MATGLSSEEERVQQLLERLTESVSTTMRDLVEENAQLRAEIVQLREENAELRRRLDSQTSSERS
jgi:hypothetical protein